MVLLQMIFPFPRGLSVFSGEACWASRGLRAEPWGPIILGDACRCVMSCSNIDLPHGLHRWQLWEPAGHRGHPKRKAVTLSSGKRLWRSDWCTFSGALLKNFITWCNSKTWIVLGILRGFPDPMHHHFGGNLPSCIHSNTFSSHTPEPRKKLGYIGDGKLPSYIGITINHYKDPYWPTSLKWKVRGFFFMAHLTFLIHFFWTLPLFGKPLQQRP